MKPAAEAMETRGLLRRQNGSLIWARPDFPAASVHLRSSSADSFAIGGVDTGAGRGDGEAEGAFRLRHPGRIYRHQGEHGPGRAPDSAAGGAG